MSEPTVQSFRQHLHDNGIDVGEGYDALWQWSVDSPAAFWRAVWDFFDLDAIAAAPLGDGDAAVLADDRMPGARWFPDIRLNLSLIHI